MKLALGGMGRAKVIAPGSECKAFADIVFQGTFHILLGNSNSMFNFRRFGFRSIAIFIA